MGEIASAVDGIGEACRALDFPVVSGNCSLYNETNGEGDIADAGHRRVGLLKMCIAWRPSRSSAKAMRSS
jgi:phosphoribosylformylglycinamidine (FGAM) synthase-like enzyme